MQVTRAHVEGILILQPKVFADGRGLFAETWNQKNFDELVGGPVRFVQDNHSSSTRGVLRGLHYQLAPHAQGKLVRVTRGAVFDVAVDLRRSSDTFGRWVGAELTEENRRQMWIPPGFAHGFLVLGDQADFLYKTTDYYAPQAERSVRWDDPTLAIAWPDIGVPPQLSEKDRGAPLLAQATTFD